LLIPGNERALARRQVELRWRNKGSQKSREGKGERPTLLRAANPKGVGDRLGICREKRRKKEKGGKKKKKEPVIAPEKKAP